ncbi:MAG: hypothetical protein JXA20_02855 [Spirochaetes bacterium]|nr:hypothetical protein [Spirochaetota bacterium]
MKKILSVLLMALALGAVIIGCNRAPQEDAQKAAEGQPAETETAQPAEPAQ